ncbi:MAG: hypothetical protein AAB909_02495 [Patescibacteria group bacterium]
MKGLEFPVIGTKKPGFDEVFNLSDRDSRAKYFEAKAGPEIEKIKQYLKSGTFMAYMVGKKGSGKGTYSGMIADIFGRDKIAFVGVGDLIREVHSGWDEFVKTDEYAELKKNYRGYISFDEAVDRLHGRNTTSLLPTEFILALLKVRLKRYSGKAIFLDGLPRDLDQVSYSLFFRELTNLRDDPDMFVMIDIPLSVIEERIKSRVVCPKCKTSRSMTMVTKDIDYEDGKFYLLCDNPECNKARMLTKEGDELGIEPIRGRLEKDEEILKKVFALHGVPKIFARNHVPVAEAEANFDEYEITPEFVLSWDGKKVNVTEKPWVIKDDNGTDCHSLLAPPVTVSLIKQLAEIL